MEKLLTLKEVSEMLGTTDPKCRFVRKLRSSGVLPGVKIGKKVLFKESDVENYVEYLFEIQNKRVFADK